MDLDKVVQTLAEEIGITEEDNPDLFTDLYQAVKADIDGIDVGE